MSDGLLTLPQVAKKLTLSQPSLYRMVREKKIEHYRLGQRRIAFDEKQVQRYLDENRRGTVI